MLIQDVEQAKSLFFSLIRGDEEYQDLNVSDLEFGDWFKLTVYLPSPPKDSAITPPYMEAFLEIQKQIYQLAALSKSGVANAAFISEDERRELDIAVVVHGGSSEFLANIQDALLKSIPQAVSKMSGRQLAAVILGIALLTATYWGTSAFLEMQKEVKLAELKSADHRATIEALSYSNKEQVAVFKEVIQVMKNSGPIGEKAADLSLSSQGSLLKAASKTDNSVINDVRIEQNEAKSLRASPRSRAETYFIIKNVRVVDVNTDDPMSMVVSFKEVEGDEEYKIKFADKLLEVSQREQVFDALGKRDSLWVEMRIKSVDGEIRNVELKRVIPPSELAYLLED
ncbi:hypothetical protein [Brucella gallinifaecis]|uniref:hypothetical protein n=1 Tax=Brucella gallinifaecis TaxID=215590 RepID=UPI00235EFD8E|nr:hypothetical protein [Brucella gallinifaecis]